MRRDLLAREALAQIPKILTLQDRNPHSPTFGCFDRNFWHYKILDFPSGMAQEFVWPLALAYTLDAPANPFYRRPALRDWVEAGIRFAAKSAHPDGSCDDYFPYERAGGAAAFSLLACLESAELVGLADDSVMGFFGRRAEWLSRHNESGRLTNHQALIALCLTLAGRALGTSRWDARRDERLARVLAWQSSEGWFQEYEGCDPGYHTLTLSVLARLQELSPDPRLAAALERAAGFAVELVHPDGSYGGEVGSRNTYNFFPHGFELVGRRIPGALAANDRFLVGVERGLAPCYADDHIIGHHAWNYLLAWRDFVSERPSAGPRPAGRVSFPEAGLLVDRRGGTELYVALNKGGVFKLFREGRLVASDTQVSLLVGRTRAAEGVADPASAAPETSASGPDGRGADSAKSAEAHPAMLRNAVAHLIGEYEREISPDEIAVGGAFGWARHTQMTPLRMVALRLLMLAGGRAFPNLVRRLLQRALITGRSDAPFTFRRVLRWVPNSRRDSTPDATPGPAGGAASGSDPDATRGGAPGANPSSASDASGAWRIVDEVRTADWSVVVAAGIGGSQTSIYNVMSRTYQAGQLQPWLDLTPAVRALSPGQPLRVEREL
jgi:hypothetical protein